MKNVIGVKSATQRLFSAAKYFLRSHSASYPPCGNDEVLKVVCCYCMTGSEVSVYVVTQVFLQGETKKKKRGNKLLSKRNKVLSDEQHGINSPLLVK